MMSTWRITYSIPITVEVKVEADNEDEAVARADDRVDWRDGEVDGVAEITEMVEEGGDDE